MNTSGTVEHGRAVTFVPLPLLLELDVEAVASVGERREHEAQRLLAAASGRDTTCASGLVGENLRSANCAASSRRTIASSTSARNSLVAPGSTPARCRARALGAFSTQVPRCSVPR